MCVWIILLLSQSHIQHNFAAKYNVFGFRYNFAAEYNVFGFRYTGIRNSYVAAIAAVGQHLQKISLC